MDFNNSLYVFNGVPGLEASKGERIAKALQKVQTKIKHLEQVRNSERGTSSKSGSSDTKDITLSDVKLQLLLLQLYHMRVQLKESRHDIAVESGHRPHLLETEYSEIQNCCKETQTGMSLHEHMPTTVPKSATTHTEETPTCTASQPTLPVKEATTSTTSNFYAIDSHVKLPSESVLPSSNDVPSHYLFDRRHWPFILGESAFDSHNAFANVQSLFAKMKTHNKALCGSRFQASRNCASSSVETNCPPDETRMMREISDGLTELTIKHAKLIEMYDNANTNHRMGNQVKYTPHYESKVNQKQAKKPSNTDSTRTGAAVRLKENRQLTSTRAAKKNKHVVPTNKIRAILPQVERQRLIRSIKDFKMQLSKEDISWI